MANDVTCTMKHLLLQTIHHSAPTITQVFTKNPGKNFSRERKLGLEKLIRLLILMGGSSVDNELLSYYNFDPQKIISKSGLIQQRDKLLPDAMLFLLTEYNHLLPVKNKFKGFELIAVDGSELNLPYNPSEESTWHDGSSPNAVHGYNSTHLNAFYSLSSCRYVDATITHGDKGRDERDSFYRMVDRYPSEKMFSTIFIADRGYSGYNSFAHVMEKHGFFIIRVKDFQTEKGILKGYDLPDTPEFDVIIRTFLTKGRWNKVMKEQKAVYHLIHKGIRFDFIDPDKPRLYPMSLRALRFEIAPGKYECIVTNLFQNELSAEDIKHIYNLRWGIETSFRELKYTIGLNNFHGKKLDFIMQEIYARMIFYNFCQVIVALAAINKGRKKQLYAVDFSKAVCICRKYLNPSTSVEPTAVLILVAKYLHQIRPGRQFERNIRSQSAVSFTYRIS